MKNYTQQYDKLTTQVQR